VVKTEILKLRGTGTEFERGMCFLCFGEEDATHILLNCRETRKWKGLVHSSRNCWVRVPIQLIVIY